MNARLAKAEFDTSFLTDVKILRARASKQIGDGVLRYRQHSLVANGINAEPVAAEFLAHSNEELAHADLLAKRIDQLGGTPDMDPANLTSRSHAEYVACDSLKDIIWENLVAERIAIESYREMIQFLGSKDSTTRIMLEGILATEEEHADDLADMLK